MILPFSAIWGFFTVKIATFKIPISYKAKRYKDGIQVMDLKK